MIRNLKNKKKKILCALTALLLCFGLSGCGAAGEPLTQTGFYFDTVIQITIYDSGKKDCLNECMTLAERYEKMLSPSVEDSDIWNINHSGGMPVNVSDETAQLLQMAISYCEMSEGRIDLTMETVSRLWDFHPEDFFPDQSSTSGLPDASRTGTPTDISPKENRIPDSAAVAEALRHVNYHNLRMEGNTVTLLDPESQISLGFIAKGYIADQLKEYLLSQGVQNAIINLGGNLLAVGTKPDGAPFRFGVRTPFDKQGTPITVLSVSDRSVVSSGVYERYFYEDDVLYHHILDTADGYPVRNGLLGVTILSDSSAAGDALSTTCFVLGPEEGMRLIESLDNVEAVFITEDYTLHYSSGLPSAE